MDVKEINEELLVEIGTWADFRKRLLVQFPQSVFEENWCRIEAIEFSLETSLGPDDECLSNTLFHLYGEKAVYKLIDLCKANNWQAFDTSLGEMLDLENPQHNGFTNFTNYLDHIKKG
jgi:hypothetical protein